MFESIFTSTSENTISISQSMLGILVAVVIGLVIAFVYTLVSKKDGYNKSFIIGLALLPAIVAAVILLVGSNVARAFSMAGAFALVRFRSAPGSAKDISVVFCNGNRSCMRTWFCYICRVLRSNNSSCICSVIGNRIWNKRCT